MSLIEIIPCLSDNYAYLIRDRETNKNILIDAPEYVRISDHLKKNNLGLDYILITHHHSDHIDGIDELRASYSPLVVGAKRDKHRLPELDIEVKEGDNIQVGSKTFSVFDVDGHTLGHIAYYLTSDKALFSGDSLMVMGCGRLFEGSAQQMWNSIKKLKKLPKETLVYSGHEYTKSNIEFALSIDPTNEKLIARQVKTKDLLEKGEATIPATLEEELDTNPFLREDNDAIAENLKIGKLDAAARFAKIRSLKDNF